MRIRLEYIAVVLLAVVVGSCYAQENATYCQIATSCAECITIGPKCGWCAGNDFLGDRCDYAETLLTSNCTDVQNPEGVIMNVTKNESLSNAGDAGDAVQVQPQEIHLTMRKGETASIEMFVRQAEDYPVDLYYIMDLSQSMQVQLNGLKSSASKIVETMQRLTSNFQIGFGSFVDKPIVPYGKIAKDGTPILEQDCIDNGCVEPYMFQHRLSLTNSTTDFETSLEDAPLSTSQDAPEGGFEALMQIAVCPENIGWREQSRHLVVYLSDQSYHVAGDGLLGGIVIPNDGECHLDSSGAYTPPNMMDYPSLGHLSAKFQDQSITPMFVVPIDVKDAYSDDFLSHIPGSKRSVLSPDPAPILEQLESFYNSLTSVITLTAHAPEELLLEFTSNCMNGVETPNSQECAGLQIGDTVSFTIDVTAESCVESGTTSFTVNPVGFSEELRVNVEVVCDCDCKDNEILNSEECSFNGTLQCGQCVCNAGNYGEMCQCSGESSGGDDRALCMAPNSQSVCSGRGECVCGQCVCEKQQNPTHVVSGKYCQCDNFNCPLYQGQLCGGPSRGTCECDPISQQSKCVCNSAYEGDNCNCLKSQDACIAPSGLVCNAHGTCECGACKCETSSPFKGETCSDCATCSGECEVYQECVQCQDPFNNGPLSAEECAMCSVDIQIVDKFPDVEYPYNCSVGHTDNCSISYILYFGDEENVQTIYVLDSTVCPPGVSSSVDARWVAVGLAIVIVIIGIILIILYKCYIMYLYRKEYEEFMKEKENAKFSQNENPLYQAPTSLHKNPAYGVQFSDDGAPTSSEHQPMMSISPQFQQSVEVKTIRDEDPDEPAPMLEEKVELPEVIMPQQIDMAEFSEETPINEVANETDT